MSRAYNFQEVEQKWREYWQAIDLYRTGEDPDKPKHYILDFFPYPSGAGLSVGHCRNYVPTCIAARFLRMKGHNVLHPMGWDAFGLPAENYAIEHNVNPRVAVQRHADNYRRQLKLVECSYDWSREINSSEPEFYRWTQWFFLLLYKRGLAYRASGSQWWCPSCQTILANEQVEDGRCWRCGSLVTRKELQQWYFKITAYADRLLQDLDGVDWPESIKAMQRNWIGRSEGAEVHFEVQGTGQEIHTFTTRPDTLFGVTFLALAPEHPLSRTLPTAERHAEVAAYVEEAQRQSAVERQAAARPKSGVFTGRYAVHPMTGQPLPIWVADYVLMDYGSGAVMGVPAHDERDLAFAQAHDIAVRRVVLPPDGAASDGCYSGYGTLVDSGPFSGLSSAQAIERIAAALEEQARGGPAVSYKMRDWLISRQRYWGAPIPIVHCAQCGTVPLPEEQLPLRLPEIDDFKPSGDGRSPLARASDWVQTTCPECGGPAQRETDTMDGFACSSWYFLRFASPHEQERPFDPQAVRYWLPVDTYVGGAEHAVLHLLYARFWTKVMYDAGLIEFAEPFQQLRNQGVLHAADGRRMSKSRGNVVTPDEVVAEHGADALRTYIVFIGPFDANVTWDDGGIRGVTRFLDRFWTFAHNPPPNHPFTQPTNHPTIQPSIHQTIKRVTADYQSFKFNTAVAALMELLNSLMDAREAGMTREQWRAALETFCALLAPIAPFISEEVWQEVLGHDESVHRQPWPEHDPSQLQAAQMTIAVQVNGRLRDTLTVPADIEAALQQAALSSPNVQRHLNGATVRRVIVVPGRVVNVVVG